MLRLQAILLERLTRTQHTQKGVRDISSQCRAFEIEGAPGIGQQTRVDVLGTDQPETSSTIADRQRRDQKKMSRPSTGLAALP